MKLGLSSAPITQLANGGKDKVNPCFFKCPQRVELFFKVCEY
jgi:hypothetical protein